VRPLRFGALFLYRPSDAADACREDRALRDGLLVYLAWVAASLLYLSLKPYDFPNANASVPPSAFLGAGLWLKVALWEPVLAVLTIASTGLVLGWMRDGWLPVKTATATLWSAVPLILTIAYVRTGMGRLPFGAAMIAWMVPGALVARRVDRAEWRRVAAFLLGLNAVALVGLVPEAAAILLRSVLLYKAAMGLSVVWLLASAGYGLRRLCGMSLARALLAFVFANLALNVAIAAAYLLHWLPMEVLKVLVYV
jgi:hypothetical protein